MRRPEIILLLGCLAVTIGVFLFSSRSNEASATHRFEQIVEESLQNLDSRMNAYLQALNGVAAFMNASDEVTARDFSDYVDTLEIDRFLPGINGIGFIAPVAEGTEDAFLAQMAALGIDDFQIHPDTGAADRIVLQYIHPPQRNRGALGLDLSFDEDRRRAALQALRTGKPQLSPRVYLVQDDSETPGFLLLRPVFEAGAVGGSTAPPSEVEGFTGWIAAPFVAANLLTDLTPLQGQAYELQVYDGLMADPDRQLYDGQEAEAPSGRYRTAQTIERFGRPWTLLHSSTPSFDATAQSNLPLILLVSGLSLTGLLAVAFRSLRQRSEALSELAALRERQIDAHEEENRSLIENAVTPVFLLDGQDCVLFANQAALVCFGYGREMLRGMTFRDLILCHSGETEDGQVNATGKTCFGQTLKLNLQRNSWTTHTGERRVTAIVRDLTSEIAVQEELAHNKALYDLALEGAQIGVFDIDLVTGKSAVSDTWRHIVGLPDDLRTPNTQAEFLQRVHPDDLPSLMQSDLACIKGETSRSITEFRINVGENNWRWMRSDARVTERAADGTALRMVGTQMDVTDLVHSRNALETSESRFRQVLAAAPVGMAILGKGGAFKSVNSALCALCGYSEAELLAGIKLGDLLPEEDLRKLYGDVQGLVAANSAEVYQTQCRIAHKRGTERWGLFNVSWTLDKNTREHVYIVQINDITDQKKLDQIKSEFVSTVSHELRTPLTSIKGALGLIDTGAQTKLQPSHVRLIEIARSNADRLTHIVNDILDLEKISSGEVAFDFNDIDLGEVIRASSSEMSPFASTHSNQLVVQLPEMPLMVRADESRTRQVLANLISNACKYSDADSDVLIRAEHLGDKAIVFIQNSGPGVPEAFRPRIFQAFSQADGSDTRAKGGTGLGLNITRQIVSRQGGSIGFESIPGGITVFWFTCPIADATAEDAPEPVQNMAESCDETLQVLHIEDDLDFSEVIRAGLGKVAQVTNVTSLARAHWALGRMKPDIIILDWALPDGDARTLLDDISRLHPSAKVISLSADSNREPDARVDIHIVKSRSGIRKVVDSITGRTAQAS
ncbi:CHASE domain-containing protein [Sulfitobacter sp. PS-8MA]|uniref:CHASE domain-containing protein n=1 Tax=Sulfitobacter sp. PS-8MA TaxID=3237707 RepID=UPI0034C6D524